MYCGKCGAELKSSDKVCPHCGAINRNYVPPVDVEDMQRKQVKSTSSKKKLKKKKIIVIIFFTIIIAVLVALLLYMRMGQSFGTQTASDDAKPNRGTGAFIDSKDKAHFILSSGVVNVSGKYIAGQSAPDESTFFLIDSNNNLCVYQNQKIQKIADAKDADEIYRSYNSVCAYTDSHGNLHLYNLESNKDTNLKSDKFIMADGEAVAAYVDKSDNLCIYNVASDKETKIAKISDDITILGVTDDGKHVVWVEDTDETPVYLNVDGVPERIGKMNSTLDTGNVTCQFINSGQGLFVDGAEFTKVIYGNTFDNIQEIETGHQQSYNVAMNQDGQKIDDENDNVSEIYMLEYQKGDDAPYVLTHIDEKGNVSETLTNIGSRCYIHDKKILYDSADGDLYISTMKDGEVDESRRITTEIFGLHMSNDGRYAFFGKSGSLYYLDLRSRDYELNKIADNFEIAPLEVLGHADIYITTQPDTIYYISDMKEIKDTYLVKGVLYKYTIGEKPVKIMNDAQDVCPFNVNETNAEHPIIRKFVKTEEDDDGDTIVFSEFGTLSNGKYVTVADKAW